MLVALGLSYSCAGVAGPRLAHQGRLIDSVGAPHNGPTTLVVSLYATENASTPLWSATYTDEAVEQGYYAVILDKDDEDDPIDTAWLSSGAWVGVRALGQDLEPRQPLHDVPVAAVARSVMIDSTSGPCTSGEIRYNNGTFEGCVETVWTNLAANSEPEPRYFRITLQGGTSNNTISMSEFQIFNEFGQLVGVNMTSATTPAPRTVTWSATAYEGNSPGWKAFDGVTSTGNYYDGHMSSGANAQVTLDLGANGSTRISKYRLWTSSYVDSGGTYRPTQWTVEASLDGTEWTVLDTYSGSAVPSGSYIERAVSVEL